MFWPGQQPQQQQQQQQQQQEQSTTDALKCLVLGPVAGFIAALVFSAAFMLSHFVMTLAAAPSVYLTMARAACASKKIGPIAKVFAVILFPIPVAVAIPILSLYGGMAGLCFGAYSGMWVCGPGGSLREPWDNLYQVHAAFSTFIENVKQGCKDELQKAQTTELGPGEEPIELNPLRAAVAVLAGMISGIIGGAAYLLVGIRVSVPVTLSTWKFTAEMQLPLPIIMIMFMMTPIVVLLVVLLYPFIGFLVCFSAAGSTLYTELDLAQLQHKINPPKPKEQPRPAAKSWLPSFLRRSVQQPDMNEPLLAPTASAPAANSWLPSFLRRPVEQPETNEPPLPETNEPQLAPASSTTERGCCKRVGHFVGVTGIPFAVQSTAQCIRQWWQVNWYVAQNGPRVVYEKLVGTCSCITNCLECIDNCLSCKCLSCWSCCCWKSARARELEGCVEQDSAPEFDEDCKESGDTLATPPEQADMDSEPV